MSQARCTVDSDPEVQSTFNAADYTPENIPEINNSGDSDGRDELYFYGHDRLRVGDVIERGDMIHSDYLVVLDFDDTDVIVWDLDDEEEFEVSRRTLIEFSQEGYYIKIIEDPFNATETLTA